MEREVSIVEILEIFRRHIASMITITIVVLLLAAAYTFFIADKIYESDATLLVGIPQSSSSTSYNYGNTDGSLVMTGPNSSDSIAAWVSTYSTAIKSTNITDAISESVGQKVTADQITLTQANDTQFMTLAVTAESPELAQAINEQLIPIFKQYISDILKVDNLQIIESPSFKSNPVSPRVLRNLGIGLITGLVLAAGYAFLRDLSDTRLRVIDDIKEITGLPVLAVVPLSENLRDEKDSKKKRGKEEA
ncbi:MAG: Wzz/FepE/Etk N-terminal domain-containing protein [Eubacterium sp.]|nr:Wzz/FepE/Etk N-terminal domain-containing protein [Eubacterium sp.]